MQVLKTALIALAVGFLAQLVQSWLKTTYLNTFLAGNLLTILIALLAINSTTTGIVLTKIRTLVEEYGNAELFAPTRDQMVLSVKEQVGLITLAIVVLTLADSPVFKGNAQLALLVDSVVVGVFVYGLMVLYDTALSVLKIVDFDPRQ